MPALKVLLVDIKLSSIGVMLIVEAPSFIYEPTSDYVGVIGVNVVLVAWEQIDRELL